MCVKEIPALRMLQWGNWLLPTPPSTHSHATTRCLHAVTPHRFHGNPRARWNVTGEYGGHLNNVVMMMKECYSCHFLTVPGDKRKHDEPDAGSGLKV